jgi:hypothetical protein
MMSYFVPVRVSVCVPAILLAALLTPTAASAPARAAEPVRAPVYVGAYSVDREFAIVTPACMDVIRSKRILFGSRSWGLGLGEILGRRDKTFALAWNSYAKERVTATNRVLKADVFARPGIVHYVFDMVPKRWPFLEDFLRQAPWTFGGKIDGAFQSLYCGPAAEAQVFADDYFPRLDKLIADFPNITFALFTHPVSAAGTDLKGAARDAASPWNLGGGDYSDRLVRRYYGKVAILDMRDIVSTHADGKPCTFEHDGKTYRMLCPEYNANKDLIHPNTPEAKDRMAKGFLILLTKMFCADMLPASLNTPKPEILK